MIRQVTRRIHDCVSAALPMLAAAPLLASTCGCVIHDGPPPSPPPAVYEPVSAAPEYAPYQPAPAPVVVEYERDLSPYGRWVYTQYGRCWVPNDRPPEWQPYTLGHWEATDQGWCWVAEGPEADWGLVAYHYGRWYDDPSNGWVWVPGDVWAPAWVAWREGDGYCGWTPLPPQCGEGVNVDVVLVDRYCPPQRYVYCDERYMVEPGGYRRYERDNVTIINRTTNITNITYVDNRVINRGVDVRHVEERSGRRVERVQLAEAQDVADARRLRQEGRPVAYAPPAVRRAEREAQPRMQQAMSAPRVRQPAQAGGRQVDPGAARQQGRWEQQQANNPRQFDAQEQARQRQMQNQERLRQQEAGRAQAEQQQRDQVQSRERARQAEARQQQDAARQQSVERQQAARDAQQRQAAEREAQRQQAAERQQAARDAEKQRAADRANAVRDRADEQRAARDAQRQRNGANQGQPQQ